MVVAWTRGHCVDYVDEHERWDNKVDGWWFNTGDLGIKTRSGKILLLDREVDVIPEMSCLEIEDVVDERLPEVLECVILGTPGLCPLPVVVTRDGRLDQQAWNTAVRDLPSLAEPVVRTWDEIPRTATGKVRRLALRAQLEGVGAPYGTGQWT
jgi:acyl-coenzyme A synthetase/AMP-(fatty) acid ligase